MLNLFYDWMGLFELRPFANLHITDVVTIDYKTYGGANLVKSIDARCSWVDVQELVDRVIYDLQYVRVPGNENLGS